MGSSVREAFPNKIVHKMTCLTDCDEISRSVTTHECFLMMVLVTSGLASFCNALSASESSDLMALYKLVFNCNFNFNT